jgi:hypothetical protein
MIEKVKAVNNPLTIIAIFAALAEIAGTVALKLVAEDLQGTFIWFVMLFPGLLVLLFFVTLNFNPKVLYAPSDFKNEENFLNAIRGANNLSLNLDEVQTQLEIAKTQIIDDAIKQIGIAGENQRTRLEEIVNLRIEPIQERVETTRESAESVAYLDARNMSIRQKILALLSLEQRAMSQQEIFNRIGSGSTRNHLGRRLRDLIDEGFIERLTTVDDAKVLYKLSRLPISHNEENK